MQDKITIRKFSESDYQGISKLSAQLGYSIEPDTVLKNIKLILRSDDHLAFVAFRKNILVGYIHCIRALRLTSKPFFEIVALVVKDSERRKGVGKMLVQTVEKYAGTKSLRVRCNIKRNEAHLFYEKLGYLLTKEQKVFEKKPGLK